MKCPWIGGKGQALASTSPFASIIPGKENRFLSLAAHDAGNIAGDKPQMQMLKQAESVIFNVDQAAAERADVLLSAALSAVDLEGAQQMGAMIQGLQAMLMMQAAQNPEIAQLAQNFKVDTQGKKIKMSLKLSEEQIKKQLSEGMKKGKF